MLSTKYQWVTVAFLVHAFLSGAMLFNNRRLLRGKGRTSLFPVSSIGNDTGRKDPAALVTTASLPHSQLFTPIERVIITANGNLQRILSAFYDEAITVTVLRTELKEGSTFTREVILGRQSELHGEILLCHILGEITVHNEGLFHCVQNGSIGVGQLFKTLKLQPDFLLRGCGRIAASSASLTLSQLKDLTAALYGTPVDQRTMNTKTTTPTALWRDYELTSDQLSCRFVEVFQPTLLQ